MGAHGSKNHRSPARYPQHYQSIHVGGHPSVNTQLQQQQQQQQQQQFQRLSSKHRQHQITTPGYAGIPQRRDLSYDAEQSFESAPTYLVDPRAPQMMPQSRQSRLRQRPLLGYATSDISVANSGPPGRVLRPILAPQSAQFDAAMMQSRNNGRYTSATNYRPSSVDRTTLMSGTLPKQVQFSTAKGGQAGQGQNRVTFGSTSAITAAVLDANSGDFEGGDTNAVFTRSKDSHRASQLAINVTYNREDSNNNNTNNKSSATLDRRPAMRAPTRSSNLRRNQALGVSSISRYRSDPALLDDNLNDLETTGGTLPRVQVEIDSDRFNVEDLQIVEPTRPIDYPQSMTLPRRQFIDERGDGQRPKLRVLRPQQTSRRQTNPGSVTSELSDIVAANSADSGVELKPELFSLLSENSPNNNNHHQQVQPSPPIAIVQRHHSLPRHLLAPKITKPVINNNNNNNQNTIDRKSLQRQEYTIPACHCEDCRHPITISRNQTQRFFEESTSSTMQRRQNNLTSNNVNVRRPLPPDPPKSPDEDEEDYYYNDECAYEGCCCDEIGNNNGKDESDYQRLVHRSYKGQPPALRRGTVLPPKTSSTTTARGGCRRGVDHSPPPQSDDLYTTAFSGESTLLRQKMSNNNSASNNVNNKPKSTKTIRAPDPPRRRGCSSMYTISPSEKENNIGNNNNNNNTVEVSSNNNNGNSATFLAKEKNGSLVIVNRVDLEIGLLSGKYVQYDIAPALLLDQAAKQVELQSSPENVEEQEEKGHQTTTATVTHHHPPPAPQSLLMTCGVGDDSTGTTSSHYDSGVSPADSSSASNTGTPGSQMVESSNSSTGSPPLLPPRQRGSSVNNPMSSSSSRRTSSIASACARSKIEQALSMRNSINMHLDPGANNAGDSSNFANINNNNGIDTTLRELVCVSPPPFEPIEQTHQNEQ